MLATTKCCFYRGKVKYRILTCYLKRYADGSWGWGSHILWRSHRSSTVKIPDHQGWEAVRTSETSVDNYFTRQYIPEDNSEHQRTWNLINYYICFTWIMFMSMEWDYASELWPPMGLLFIPWIYKYGEPWWNDANRRKPKNSKKNLSQCHFVHHKSHMDWMWPLQWITHMDWTWPLRWITTWAMAMHTWIIVCTTFGKNFPNAGESQQKHHQKSQLKSCICQCTTLIWMS
jgi:hypothetical protein